MTNASCLEVKGITKRFGGLYANDQIDFVVQEGEIVSIIGPNGAGKSTLINLITGNLPVQTGSLLFKGRDITRLPIHERVKLGICRSFQVVNIFPELTVFENLMIPVLTMGGKSRTLFSPISRETSSVLKVETLLKKVGL